METSVSKYLKVPFSGNGVRVAHEGQPDIVVFRYVIRPDEIILVADDFGNGQELTRRF